MAAQPDPLYEDVEELTFPDPLESVNRATLQLNRQLDRFLIEPITSAYTFIVPSGARRCVQRFFQNLNSPSILANDVHVNLRRHLRFVLGHLNVRYPATRMYVAVHRYRIEESKFVRTIVHHVVVAKNPIHHINAARHSRYQREDQETVGDRGLERTLGSTALNIDV